MSDYDWSGHLESLLKEQSRDAYQWSRAIKGAFWATQGKDLDFDYLLTCMANAMMSMHDSVKSECGDKIEALEKQLADAKVRCVDEVFAHGVTSEKLAIAICTLGRLEKYIAFNGDKWVQDESHNALAAIDKVGV